MVKVLVLFSVLFFSVGCTVDEKTMGFETPTSQKPARTKYRTFISDEELKTQKELALIEANKSIALSKIDAEARLRQLELEREKELALLREKERLLAIEHRQAMERYLILGAVALLLLIGAALLWYFDRRRKDKLRAYEDNLQKYFHQKENEARIKIAEKILDTVASGELGLEQKTKLIEALHGPVTATPPAEEKRGDDPALPPKSPEDEDLVIEAETDEKEENATDRRKNS